MIKQIPTEISAQVSQARVVIELYLASTLESIHLFGSAVDGGLKPHCDIDLLVTVKAPIHNDHLADFIGYANRK